MDVSYFCAVIKGRKFLILFSLLLVCCVVSAQKTPTDSLDKLRKDPKKAAIYSAICPGLGQIYNGKAWKTAIIYAGFGGITAGFIYNQKNYKSYQKAVNARFDTLDYTIDTQYPNLMDGTVLSLRNYHRRNRDIFILTYFALYALNIIDANVDAHLREFKINKDLSLAWQPLLTLNQATKPEGRLNLTLTF